MLLINTENLQNEGDREKRVVGLANTTLLRMPNRQQTKDAKAKCDKNEKVIVLKMTF